MPQPTFDLSAFFNAYRDAMAPLFRAQQEALKTVERLARYQLAVAGDCLDWGLSHAKTIAAPKSIPDLVGEQTSLNASFTEKLRARAEEFSQIASETQGAVGKWFDETGSKVSETIKKQAA